jgi:ribonucleoside-diphosphate reductase alpha chain
VISNDNLQVFAELISFQHPDKQAKLADLLADYTRTPNRERFAVTVAAITPDGVEPVYDCTVPGPACFDANGLVAHNCGEIFLPPNSACNLGSLVLTKFVHRTDQGDLTIAWKELAESVEIAIRFLDNVLDVSEFATPDQKHNVRHVFRQLGLGIMGWADYLKLARIPYDSEEHLAEIDRWGSWIAQHAYRASEAIAAEKGPCGIWDQIQAVRTGNLFEQWVDSEGNPYNGIEAFESERQDLTQVPRRNSTVLSIAPTGSIAQLAACSWAFEPDFGLTVWKQVFVDASKNQQNWIQILNPYLEELGLSDADAEIVKRTGSLRGTDLAQTHPDIARSFKIAREVPPGWHILVQSKWQDWIDSSISKTINLPAHATIAEIQQIYRLAQKAGLKGVTIYRSGTLESEPIKVGDEEKQED